MQRYLLVVFVLLFIVSTKATAQFEGSFSIKTYAIHGDENQERLVNNIAVVSNRQRLLFHDMTNIRALNGITGMNVERILIRNDRNDIVFLSEERALTLGKQQLQALGNMMAGMSQQEGVQLRAHVPEYQMKETTETKQIGRYTARKWIATAEEVTEELHIWITEDVTVQWGMLGESWFHDLPFFQGFPHQRWMRDKGVPVEIQRFDNYELTEIVRFENFQEYAVLQSDISIPDDLQVITFQQLLMDRMNRR